MEILIGIKLQTDMKKVFKFFAAALAIVVAVSCSKDNTHNENIDQDQPKSRMTFLASIDPEVAQPTNSATVKTALDGKSVIWTRNDKISLYGNGTYNTADGYNKHKGDCMVDASGFTEGSDVVSFVGDVASSSDYCALYPADGWKVNTMVDYKYEFVGFAEQKAVAGSFDRSKHVMVAGKLEGTRFNFKNVCALAKVKIETDIVYSIKITGQPSAGSIGGPYGWKVNATRNEFAAVTSNQVHSITLKNENGAPLEDGATYYIVLPACTISGYTVSVCDEDGVVIGERVKKSDFVVERNKIYDMGVFDEVNVKPVTKINLTPSSLNLSATIGFDFFSITSNVFWRISTDANWLSFSATTGDPGTTSNIKVSATDNTSYTSRTATVTVSDGVVSSILTVTQAGATKPQTYKKVSQVYPNELKDGGKYVIANYGDNSLYWTNNGNKAVLSTLTNGEIRKENVLIFTKTSDSAGLTTHVKAWYGTTSKDGYASQILGTWKSLVNNYGLGDTFQFGAGTILYVGMGGRWNSGSSYDIDMYKNPANTFIYRNGTTLNIAVDVNQAESAHGQGGRKWLIWEVTEE